MSTKPNVEKVHTSLMQNTAKKATGKAAPAKKATGKAAPAKAAPANKNKKPYTRNTATTQLFGSALAALGGAAIITGFDFVVNQYAPQISGTIRTVVKAGAGVGFLLFGKKIPVIGAYSQPIGAAFMLAAGLDVFGNVVIPQLVAWLSPASAPKEVITEKGELGMQYQLPNGDQLVVVNENQNANYSPSYAGAASYYPN